MLALITIVMCATLAYISTTEKGLTRNERNPEKIAQREELSFRNQSQGLILGNGIRLESTESLPSN